MINHPFWRICFQIVFPYIFPTWSYPIVSYTIVSYYSYPHDIFLYPIDYIFVFLWYIFVSHCFPFPNQPSVWSMSWMVISRLSFDGSPPGAQMAQGSLQGFNECPQGFKHVGSEWDPNWGWGDGPSEWDGPSGFIQFYKPKRSIWMHMISPSTLWLCQNSYWTWPFSSLIYPLIAWWFSSLLCKGLPECYR